MLKIERRDYDAIRRHGEETYPHECCGVLLGQMDGDTKAVTSIARADNTRIDSAHNRYNIDPKDLIRIQREGRGRGEDIVGFYHSHPDHPAQWSQTDLAEAHWFGCSYVITSVEKGTAVLTNSFALTGSDETDKKFVDEIISAGSPADPQAKIRLASAADLPAIIPVVNAAFTVETFIDGPRVDENGINKMAQRGEFLIAQDASGSVIAAVYVEQRGERGYFGMLAVDPSYQGKNLGRVMANAAEDHCRNLGCKFMDITVLSLRPELPPYYRKLGYVETGTEEFRPHSPLKAGLECHCIVMSKTL